MAKNFGSILIVVCFFWSSISSAEIPANTIWGIAGGVPFKSQKIESEQRSGIRLYSEESGLWSHDIRITLQPTPGIRLRDGKPVATNGALELRRMGGYKLFFKQSHAIDKKNEWRESVSVSSDGDFSAKISLRVRGLGPYRGKDLRESYGNGEFELEIVFGKVERYRIPFSVKLLIEGKRKTQLQGSSYIMLGDVALKGGKLDTSNDSRDTLRYLAVEYLIDQKNEKSLGVEDCGATFTSVRATSRGYRSGFVECRRQYGGPFYKLILVKEKKQWKVSHELEKDTLYWAHTPNIEYTTHSSCALETKSAIFEVGKKMERWIKNRNIEFDKLNIKPDGQVEETRGRITQPRCEIDCNFRKGTCCQSFQYDEEYYDKNYYLEQRDDKMVVVKEIDLNQVLDRESGKIVVDEKRNPNRCGWGSW